MSQAEGPQLLVRAVTPFPARTRLRRELADRAADPALTDELAHLTGQTLDEL
ncbi:MAG: hypothetical protein ACRDP4_07080 [Nocardioidaceae bacterium]